VQGEEPEAEAVTWLARHGCYIRQGNGFHQALIVAIEHHGINAIIGMFDRLASAGTAQGDVKGYVFGAIDALNARTRPDAVALARDDEKVADRAKREAVSGRQLAESRRLIEGSPLSKEQTTVNLSRLHDDLEKHGLL
jgi:hypothetical protein